MRAFARAGSLMLVTLVASRCLADDALAGSAQTEAAASPEVAPKAPEELRFPFVAGALHVGLLPYGRGQNANGCSGACTGFAADNASYQHGVALGVGADAFVTFLDVLRVGPSLFYVLPNHVDLDGASGHFGVGSDLGLDLAVEAAPRVSRRMRIVPRVQGGATVLFPGGELARTLDALHDVCPTGARGCDSLTGPRVGWNLGLGVGALYFLTDHVRLRADILVEYYSVRLYSVGASLFANPIDVSETLSGGRSFVMLGAEY